jgi:hypothetical protein
VPASGASLKQRGDVLWAYSGGGSSVQVNRVASCSL